MRNEALLVLFFYFFQNMLLLTKYGRVGFYCFKKKQSLLAQTGFQMTCWDFGHLKTSLLAQTGFQRTFWDFGFQKSIFWAIAH